MGIGKPLRRKKIFWVSGLVLILGMGVHLVHAASLYTIEDYKAEMGFYSSITSIGGKLATSYHDIAGGSLRLWYDEDGDFVPEKKNGEIRIIAGGKNIFENVGENSSIMDFNGKLAISYYDFTRKWLWLWYDENGDFRAQKKENRVIDRSGDDVGWYTAITDVDGKLAISYWDVINGDLKLWVDENGNFKAESEERRMIDGKDETVGEYSSITKLNGKLAISYYDSTSGDLKLWYDKNGNHNSDEGEIQIIDGRYSDVGWFTSIVVVDGKLAISYYDLTNKDLRLWIDENGDMAADSEETRRIDEEDGDLGTWSDITLHKGKLAISYREGDRFESGALKLWYDANGNLSYDPGEASMIDGPKHDVGEHNSITEVNGFLAISYRDHTDGNPKLAIVSPETN